MRIGVLGFVLIWFSLSYANDSLNCPTILANAIGKSELSREARELAIQSKVIASGNILNRKLSTSQESALNEAFSIGHQNAYTSSDLVLQNRVLDAAGFSANEVKELRAKGVLGNWSVKWNAPVPEEVAVMSIRTSPLDKKVLSQLKNGKKMGYMIDDLGHLHITPDTTLKKSSLWLVKQEGGETASSFLVKESGEMIFDPVSRDYVFKPKYSIDLSSQEVSALRSELAKSHPDVKFTHQPNPQLLQSKAVDCLDVLSSQSKGKNFVVDRIIGDNTVMVTAIVATELAGAGRLSTEQGQQTVLADALAGNLSIAINGVLGKHLVLGNVNALTSMAARAGVATALTEINKHVVYKNILQDDSEARAESIASFDRAHFLARLPLNHYFDKYLVNGLPSMLFSACKSNSKMKIFISPRSVRMVERYSSAILYYGLRKSIIDE